MSCGQDTWKRHRLNPPMFWMKWCTLKFRSTVSCLSRVAIQISTWILVGLQFGTIYLKGVRWVVNVDGSSAFNIRNLSHTLTRKSPLYTWVDTLSAGVYTCHKALQEYPIIDTFFGVGFNRPLGFAPAHCMLSLGDIRCQRIGQLRSWSNAVT